MPTPPRFALGLALATLASACVGDSPQVAPDAGPDVATNDTGVPDAGSPDARDAADAMPLRCDVTKPFDPPTVVTGLNLTALDLLDETTLLRASAFPTGDLSISKGTAFPAAWGPADTTLFAAVNSPTAHDGDAVFAPDGLSVVFASDRAGGSGGFDLYAATRPNLQAAFGAPQALSSINSTAQDIRPAYARDGKSLCFTSNRSTSMDIWCSTITGGNFGAPASLSINGTDSDAVPVLSADGLSIYFQSNRPPSAKLDIWRSTRKTTSDLWGAPTAVAELNSAEDEWPQWLSTDGCVLYMIRQTDTVMVAKRP